MNASREILNAEFFELKTKEGRGQQTKNPLGQPVHDKTVTVELIGQKKGNVLLIEGKEFKL